MEDVWTQILEIMSLSFMDLQLHPHFQINEPLRKLRKGTSQPPSIHSLMPHQTLPLLSSSNPYIAQNLQLTNIRPNLNYHDQGSRNSLPSSLSQSHRNSNLDSNNFYPILILREHETFSYYIFNRLNPKFSDLKTVKPHHLSFSLILHDMDPFYSQI